MPSQRTREQRQYRDAYRRNAPTKGSLLKEMKSSKYVVLRDRFGRLYFVDSQNDLHVQGGVSKEVDCYVVLPRTSEPPDAPDTDERVYTFPEDGERLELSIKRWKGVAWKARARRTAPTVSASVYDPYQHARSATGAVVLVLTSTLEAPVR
jgi:hypothetical protein